MDILLKQLIEAITLQSQAINNLAQSNMALVGAMSRDEVYGDAEPSLYLNGKPVV